MRFSGADRSEAEVGIRLQAPGSAGF